MKVSLFGYNRKETDEYFNYLNENSNIQAEKIRSLEEKLAEAQKSIDEYRKLDEINRQEIETLNDTVEQYRADDEDQKRQIDELTRKLDGKTDVPESDRLGFIFAVAYRDIANKNKAVSAKIRDYAEMMFNRMTDYRSEVAAIVDSVTDMQNRQRDELAKLCAEATEKLNMLTEASASTLEDMKKIEETRGDIYSEIENMITETVNTDTAPIVISSAEEKSQAEND